MNEEIYNNSDSKNVVLQTLEFEPVGEQGNLQNPAPLVAPTVSELLMIEKVGSWIGQVKLVLATTVVLVISLMIYSTFNRGDEIDELMSTPSKLQAADGLELVEAGKVVNADAPAVLNKTASSDTQAQRTTKEISIQDTSAPRAIKTEAKAARKLANATPDTDRRARARAKAQKTSKKTLAAKSFD